MEISSLSDEEFKTLVIRMLKELTGCFDSIKKKAQAEMKVILSEMKNLQGTNSGVDEAEDQINNSEHRKKKNIQLEEQEEKRINKKPRRG